jgi:hypothetical protein
MGRWKGLGGSGIGAGRAGMAARGKLRLGSCRTMSGLPVELGAGAGSAGGRAGAPEKHYRPCFGADWFTPFHLSP